jgi:hypothetical protein
MNEHYEARARKVFEIIAAGPDSLAKTIIEVCHETGAWGDLELLEEDVRKEVRELLLSVMVEETGGRWHPGGSHDQQR